MLKPIVNLCMKDSDYRKTIFFDTENLSLELGECNKEILSETPFMFHILEPLNPEELKIFHYEDMGYCANLYVPIFNEETEYLRAAYLFGRGCQSMEYVKYPSIDEPNAYSVSEIHYVADAGTDNKGDVIYINISYFSSFTEGEQLEEILSKGKKVARKMIPTVTTDAVLDSKVEEMNRLRPNNMLSINFQYHMFGGKPVLLDLNLRELVRNVFETPLMKPQKIDLSLFDLLSINVNAEIEYQKNNLLELQKANRAICLIISKKQETFLRKQLVVSDATWKKYLKLGIFEVV